MKNDLYPDVMKKVQKALKVNSFQVAETSLRRAIDEHLVAAYCLAKDGHLKNMNGGAGPGEGAFQTIDPVSEVNDGDDTKDPAAPTGRVAGPQAAPDTPRQGVL